MYNHGFRSVYKLTAHIVLVVKYRRKAINSNILARLNVIFQETLEKWKCSLLEFNGESDHVHLLIEYKPDICLSTLDRVLFCCQLWWRNNTTAKEICGQSRHTKSGK